MDDDHGQLLPLALVFLSFSFLSVGGGPSIFAPMQHQAVDVHQWVSAREFTTLFAISRVAPGPGSMLSTLVGWQVDGWIGAIVATVALFVPSSLLLYGLALLWNKYRGREWHTALQNGLAPVGTGLILAGVLAISRVAGAGVLAWGVAGGAVLVLVARPRFHPLLLLTGGGLVFLAAWAIGR